jgi:hypothetical protein
MQPHINRKQPHMEGDQPQLDTWPGSSFIGKEAATSDRRVPSAGQVQLQLDRE